MVCNALSFSLPAVLNALRNFEFPAFCLSLMHSASEGLNKREVNSNWSSPKHEIDEMTSSKPGAYSLLPSRMKEISCKQLGMEVAK